jgi:hypothetical protein
MIYIIFFLGQKPEDEWTPVRIYNEAMKHKAYMDFEMLKNMDQFLVSLKQYNLKDLGGILNMNQGKVILLSEEV